MTIFLLGYMGSGKSTIGSQLASRLGYSFIDFDDYIVAKESKSISAIFDAHGEIYFRKKEALYLQELLDTNLQKHVIALGGGTPCYGNAMEILQKSEAQSIYLNVAVEVLGKRLWEARSGRPLLTRFESYDELETYVRKHLFERSYFYNQADTRIKVGQHDTVDTVVEAIVSRLF
ncbi:MAG: shikimate kinase [Dokdonia sp.]|jgi:shikimate kinase|nr:shikimate kinase [Cytophagaceae bacterium]|tara:strand:- start:648 stop:1172 length:525 start_codon:yes stop_codon:yes gene_type:complete